MSISYQYVSILFGETAAVGSAAAVTGSAAGLTGYESPATNKKPFRSKTDIQKENQDKKKESN